MKKKLIIIFFVMLMTALLGVVASADPDGPQFVTPTQYSEHKMGENISVRWTRPDGGTGSANTYIFAVRIFGLEENVTDSNAGIRIINEEMYSNRSSFLIEGSLLMQYFSLLENEYAKLRLSVCAVQNGGIKKWSDHQYIYISAHNTPIDKPISFHIYNGFTHDSKEQIYYACQNWNNHLNLGREVVNTYPYSMGTNLTDYDLNDGVNIVTKKRGNPKDLMVTHYAVSINESSKYKLIEADIVVNSDKTWSNSPQPGKHYFYEAIIHEIGHVIGLNDKYDSWAANWTMYGISLPGEQHKITLEEQDIKNAKSLYQ